MLVTMAVAGIAYVLTLVLEIVGVIAPAATSLRAHAHDLMREHDAMHQNLEVLRGRLAVVIAATNRLPSGGTLAQDQANALSDPIKSSLDTIGSMRASLALSASFPEMRIHLAKAVENETSGALTLLDAVNALEGGHLDDARRAVETADIELDSTSLELEAAQGAAIAGLLAREDELLGATQLVSRWAGGWAALGAVMLGLAIWLVRRRVYQPIADLDRAMARVMGGDLSASPPHARDDELGRLTAHFAALTEVLRERTAELTRRHETLTERFGRILDQSSNEIYLFDATTLRFVQANRGALANLGYTMEELSALTPMDILDGLPEESFDAALSILRLKGQPALVLPASQRRKDGTSYPVEIRLQLSEAGDSPVFVGVVDDVSERSRVRRLNDRLRQFAVNQQRLIGSGDLEAALGAITEMATEALQISRVGVWTYQPDRLTCLDAFTRGTGEHTRGEEVRWDEQSAYLRAIRSGETIAASDTRSDPRTIELVRPGGPREGVRAQLDIPVRAAGRLAAVITYEDLAGTRRWSAEEQAFARSVADLAALAMEAAERTRLEQQLAKAQKMDSIGRLAGGVAHDFNNLLTAILGNVELAQLTLPPRAPVRNELTEIESAARRAADLTRQLLTFARTQVVQLRVVDLNALTRGADKLLRRLVGEDIELVTILAPDLASVRIDRGQFEQVIVNLSVNARDAMPNGGRLTIETQNITLGADFVATHAGAVVGDFVQLAVSDTGHGMDRETLNRLFEPFFTTKDQGKGTGLGLAICYGIVRQAGGNIWVYSEPGRGTTIKVHLPRVDTPPDVIDVDSRAEPPRGREAILLVEDEGQIRELVARVLRGQGYTVIVASNGEEASRIASDQTLHLDLVVTDVVLPLVGGRELVSRVRRERPLIPVIYMSGYTRGAVADAELLDEHTSFLSKPFTPSELAKKVREVLDSIELS
jgi:PAS domain S-box-containing protein